MKLELKNPAELRRHKLHRLPEPDLTSPEWFAFLDRFHAAGPDAMPEIVINETGFVMDGWRRVLAARNWKWPEVRCVVRPDEEAALIMVESLLGQRDLSREFKLYALVPLYADYAEQAEKRRLANLRRGVKTNEKPLIFPKSRTETSENHHSLQSWAEALGVARATFFRILQIHDLLNDPDCAALAAMHKKCAVKVPHRPALQKLQADLRSEFEPRFEQGALNAWGVLSGINGKIATDGLGREDTKPLQLDFWTQPLNKWRTGFQSWGRIKEEVQQRIEREWRATLADLPERLRLATIEELSKDA